MFRLKEIKAKKMEIKAVQIEPLGIWVLNMPTGKYIINGSPYFHDAQSVLAPLQMKEVKEIRVVDSSRVISHYENASGEKLSAENYTNKHQELSPKWNSDLEESAFATLEDEFAYRKFVATWFPIYKTVEVVSEPLTIFKSLVKLDTGCEFIKSLFLDCADFPQKESLYHYKRNQALASIIKNTFNNLGMILDEGASLETTKTQKVWAGLKYGGQNSANNFGFIHAFGTYLFSGMNLKNVSGQVGQLDEMIALYEKDRKDIERTIILGFKMHFENSTLTKADAKTIYEKLKNIYSLARGVDSKEKTKREYVGLRNEIAGLMNRIGDIFLEK